MKKLSFLELEREMAVLTNEESLRTKGGTDPNPPSWDCVLNCFDYIDDGVMDGYSSYYSGGTIMPGGSAHSGQGLPYNPEEAGGIRWQDFHQVGANGEIDVEEIQNPHIHANGLTDSGQHIMMTLPGTNGLGHAVVITGVRQENWKTYIDYRDPTTDQDNYIINSEDNPIATGFYTVSTMNSTTPLPSTTVPSTTMSSTTMI